MLTLTRRNHGKDDPKSQIVLRCACGEVIVVTVVDSGTCETKLAFDASKTVSVLRRELLLGKNPCNKPDKP